MSEIPPQRWRTVAAEMSWWSITPSLLGTLRELKIDLGFDIKRIEAIRKNIF
jgi:hypothetical protein